METDSFTRAGERLFLTQPTVTAHIKALEEAVGRQLLIRSTRGMQITEAGSRVYDYAVSTLRQRDRLLAELGCRGSDTVGIGIAASSVPALYLLPELLAGFRRQRPLAEFSVTTCDSAEVERRVREQRADIGLCGSRTPDSDCEYRPVAVDRLVVITPPIPPFSTLDPDEPFPLSLLLKEPMIAREVGSGTRREFEAWLRLCAPTAQPSVMVVMEDTLPIKKAVAAGMGIAVVSERAAADSAQSGQLLSFSLKGAAERGIYLVRHKSSRLAGLPREFFQYVQLALSVEDAQI